MGDAAADKGRLGLGGQSVMFTLPSLPGSVNQIYEPGYSIGSNRPAWRIKGEWAIWQTRIKPYIPLFKVTAGSIIRIDRCYYYPWFYGNGSWRQADVANMDKLLFDTVAKKIGVNDLLFKCGWMDSRDSPENKVVVTLTEITETEWRNNSNHSQQP